MKVSKKPIDSKYFGHYINNLWSVFTLIDDKEQIRKLLRDLLTHTEYKMLTKRLEIARRLLSGQTYRDIMHDLKVTERTISTVSNILERAGEGYRVGHRKLLDLEKSFQGKKEARQNYLERKNFPKLPEQVLVKNLVKAGFAKVDQTFRRRTREVSVKKQLTV